MASTSKKACVMNKLPYDKRHLPFGNSSAILDEQVLSHIKTLDLNIVDMLYDPSIKDDFCKAYVEWIQTSKLNSIIGIEDFPYTCYSNGTTEAFDKFYAKNSSKRFRCFKGEYMYHQLSWRNNYPNWSFIEDDELKNNDAVVISLPFSDTGTPHLQLHDVLTVCSNLNIPVLLDCAYLGICSNIVFNFKYPCITDIVFSLSKAFPVAHARIGIRLTKEDNDDPLFVINKSNYINRFGAKLGLHLINKFSPDYIPNMYKEKQQLMCQHLSVEVSNTVLFGIGNSSWNEYNRGRDTNRLSFHKYLHLPIENFYNEY
jgi:hypothetical protein